MAWSTGSLSLYTVAPGFNDMAINIVANMIYSELAESNPPVAIFKMTYYIVFVICVFPSTLESLSKQNKSLLYYTTSSNFRPFDLYSNLWPWDILIPPSSIFIQQ